MNTAILTALAVVAAALLWGMVVGYRARESGITAPADFVKRIRLRTLAVSIVLIGAIGITSIGMVAALSPPKRDESLSVFLSRASKACVSLDISGSMINVGDAEFVQGFFAELGGLPSDRGLCLILFAQTAYQMWDLGGSPALFIDLDRQFEVEINKYGVEVLPPFAWKNAVATGDTRISRGLWLALDEIERAGAKDGAIILVSDLQTAASDVTEFGLALSEIRQRGHLMLVIAVNASDEDRIFVESVVGKNAFVFEIDKEAFLEELEKRTALESAGLMNAERLQRFSDETIIVSTLLFVGVIAIALAWTTPTPWTSKRKELP